MRDRDVTGVQTCALPICLKSGGRHELARAAGHDDLHLRAAVSQPPHEVRTLVGGDAARHAEKRSEERRVGKECRARWWAAYYKKKHMNTHGKRNRCVCTR